MRALSIAFHHADFYLLNKPAGAPMHANQQELSVVHQLAAQTGETLYPVHRLDTPTSGALLIARNKAAAARLSQLFEQRQIGKTYVAIATGKPSKKQGLISGDMDNARRGNWRLLHSQNNPAQTRFVSHSLKPGYRYYLLQPITGRTHQLRVALKSLGAPIVGDNRYGGEQHDYLHLHAWKLSFDYENSHYALSVDLPSYGLFTELPALD